MKDDCLLEMAGDGCDPPVPGVKGLALGLKAIRGGGGGIERLAQDRGGDELE